MGLLDSRCLSQTCWRCFCSWPAYVRLCPPGHQSDWGRQWRPSRCRQTSPCTQSHGTLSLQQHNSIHLTTLVCLHRVKQCSRWSFVTLQGRGSAIRSPVAGSSLTNSLSSSLVSSQRSQGNLNFSFVKVFIRDACGNTKRVNRANLLSHLLLPNVVHYIGCETSSLFVDVFS